MWFSGGPLGSANLKALINHPVMGLVVIALLCVGIVMPLAGLLWSPAKVLLLTHLAIACIFAAALAPAAWRAIRHG